MLHVATSGGYFEPKTRGRKETHGAGEVDTTSIVQQLLTTRSYSSRKKKLQVRRALPAAHPHIATE